MIRISKKESKRYFRILRKVSNTGFITVKNFCFAHTNGYIKYEDREKAEIAAVNYLKGLKEESKEEFKLELREENNIIFDYIDGNSELEEKTSI